jgi:hypothetical protein
MWQKQVDWEPYGLIDAKYQENHFSVVCKIDRDMWMMKCPLICFYCVEWQLPNRVARQYGLRQEWPVTSSDTDKRLHE